MLNEQVLLLSKKHGQLKQAITKMVQVVMGFLDDAPNLDAKLALIDTLRTVTEGKVTYLHYQTGYVWRSGVWCLLLLYLSVIIADVSYLNF